MHEDWRTMFERVKQTVINTANKTQNQYAVQVNIPTIGWVTFVTDTPHATAVAIAENFIANDIHPDDIVVRPTDNLIDPAAPHITDTRRDIPEPYKTASNTPPQPEHTS